MRGGQRLGAGRKPEPDARRALLQVRVTDDELVRIRKTADYYGVTVSELVRKALGLDRRSGSIT